MILKVKSVVKHSWLILGLLCIVNKTLAQTEIDKANQKINEVNRKINEVNNTIDNIFGKKKKSKETNPSNPRNTSKNINLKSLNLSGRWKGTCERTAAYTYDFSLNLTQVNNILSGTAELRTSHSSTKYSVSGRKENNTFVLYQDAVLEEFGTNFSWKLDFTGLIAEEDGIITIKGTGVQTNQLCFNNKKIERSDIGITDKDFFIKKLDEAEENSKAQKQCISGNCENGRGVKVTDLGRYDGEFKDGKMDGKGTFDYSSGIYKGNRYIGEFTNDAFNGYGTLYDVVDIETSNSLSYKNNISKVRTNTGDVLYPIYEGNWLQNYPRGKGKMYDKGLPKLGVWVGWYLDNHKALEFSDLKYHLDTTFKNFQKCNCLSPGKININATGLGSVLYDVYDAETGKKIRQQSEIEQVDKSFVTNGYINKSNKIIYIKCYQKVHNIYNNQDEYIDESYVVIPNGETLLNYRALPEAGDFIEVKAKENFIYLGQYCLKNTGTCKPIGK